MARTARASVGGICYHVINRGNGKAEVFHKAEDYYRFTEMMQQSCQRLPLRIVGWCLMPNHFHLVLWPFADGDLSRWMQWLMTCHVRRHHRHYESSGHIWQGRFKAFPIQQDEHFLKVLRDVERNPVRAGLVERAQYWRWSSLHPSGPRQVVRLLSPGPISRPSNWRDLVNQPETPEDVARLRTCINRCRPFGSQKESRMSPFLILIFIVACVWATATKAAHVTINADGVLVIDGRKILPIGFTGGPPPDGKTPEGKPAFEEIRAAGGTFFRTGLQGGNSWNEDTIAQEQIMMDAAARYGLYCWPRLEKLSSLQEGDRAKELLLRSVLNRFRRHPGLLLWKNVDEPFWGKVSAESMVRAYQIIKEVDPCHPVGLTQAPRGTVADLRPYDAAADILLLDIYPVGYPPGMHSLWPNKEISMVGDYTRFIKEAANGKPVWMVLQIAWSGVVNPGKTLRFPTFAQERFMTYQALINGARGLIYFGGSIKAAMTPEDADLGWNWTFWRRVLRPVLEEVGTRSPLAPALVAPDSKLAIKLEGTDDVEFCVREVEGDIYILACKREGKTVQVKFTGLPAWAADGEVLYESPRKVQAKAGRFTDWFAPFDVHVYHFRHQEAPREMSRQ